LTVCAVPEVMFRAAFYRCAAALDRIDYLVTLTRLGVLDRFAGPMCESPVGPLGEKRVQPLRVPSNALARAKPAPPENDGAGDGIKAVPPALVAD
jgi:hypothetical protein